MRKKIDFYLCLKITSYLLLLGLLLYWLYNSPYNPHPKSVADIRYWDTWLWCMGSAYLCRRIYD